MRASPRPSQEVRQLSDLRLSGSVLLLLSERCKTDHRSSSNHRDSRQRRHRPLMIARLPQSPSHDARYGFLAVSAARRNRLGRFLYLYRELDHLSSLLRGTPRPFFIWTAKFRKASADFGGHCRKRKKSRVCRDSQIRAITFNLPLRRWLCIPRTAGWATTCSSTDGLNID